MASVGRAVGAVGRGARRLVGLGPATIFSASRNGRANVVKALLFKNDVNVETEDVKNNLFKNNVKDIVSQMDKNGRTPLWLASQYNRADVVKLLLAAGADVNKADKFGETPLMAASQKGHTKVVELLLAAPGINVNQIKKAVNSTKRVNIKNLLTKAVKNREAAAAAKAEQEAKNAKNAANREAAAAAKAEQEAKNAKNAANREAAIKNARNKTNLFNKIVKGDYNVKLIDNFNTLYKNVNHKFKNGMTLLHHAALQGKEDVVKLLLGKGANVDEPNNQAQTALYLASEQGHTDVVKLLLEKGADVNRAANDGRTPLRVASKAGKTDVVKLLLEKGADVNVVGNGKTPFQAATNNEIKVLLLEKGGANIATLNNVNKQALLRQAIKSNKNKIVNSLIKAGAKVEEDGKYNIKGNGMKKLLARTIEQQKNSNKPSLGYGYNNNETLKKYLRTVNGRKQLRGTYKMYSRDNNTNSIESVLKLLQRSGKLNKVELQNLLNEYQRKLNTYNSGTPERKELEQAIENTKAAVKAQAEANANVPNSSKPVNNAALRAKVNQVKKSIPEGLLNNPQAKVGLVLKSNGSPYKLVNYTKLKNAINKFKDTGKNQPLNNNTIITNAAKGTWNLVEVPRNLLA